MKTRTMGDILVAISPMKAIWKELWISIWTRRRLPRDPTKSARLSFVSWLQDSTAQRIQLRSDLSTCRRRWTSSSTMQGWTQKVRAKTTWKPDLKRLAHPWEPTLTLIFWIQIWFSRRHHRRIVTNSRHPKSTVVLNSFPCICCQICEPTRETREVTR